jgi:hypothetical protein
MGEMSLILSKHVPSVDCKLPTHCVVDVYSYTTVTLCWQESPGAECAKYVVLVPSTQLHKHP